MSTLKTNNIQHVDRSDPSIIINTDGSVNIAGTMTYEDVTNVDAVGIITGRNNIDAQKQVHVGTGVSVKAGGINVTAGITTVQALQAQAISGTTGTFTGDVSIAENIIHTGDTNTKISFPAADTINFSTGGSERVRITSGGLVGVGQGTPTHMLHVDSSNASDSTATAFFKGRIVRVDGSASANSPRLNFSLDGTDKAQILCHRTSIGIDIATLVAEPIKFKINSSEALRIDSSGRVVIGATSSNNVGGFGGAAFQVEGLTASTSAFSIIRHSADTVGSSILMGKSRGTSDGATTVVQSGDVVARIIAYGADGTDTESSLGAIQFDVDGTPGGNDMPGRIVFSTTPDGSATYTERLRIDSRGQIGVGVVPTAQYAHNLIQIGHQATLGANAALSATGQTFLTHNLYFDTGGTFRVFNTSNANEGAIFRLVDGQLLFSNSAATTGTPTVTERFRIDANGNMGLGITPDAHDTATTKSLQIGTATNLYNESSDDYTILGNNIYYDGSANKRIKGQETTRLMQWAGNLQFDQAGADSADSAITYSTPFKIINDGRIQCGSQVVSGGMDMGFGVQQFSSKSDTFSAGIFGSTAASLITSIIYNSHSSFNTNMCDWRSVRSNNSAFNFLRCSTSSATDNEFFMTGEGILYSDGGTTMQSPADYAEMFEWSDGNSSDEDRRGYTVVLDGNKVRIATSSDSTDNIIGVVSGNPAVLADNAWDRWAEKYQKDDYNCYVRNSDGDRILNSDYDDTQTYVPREDRKEWDAIGMVGKLRVRKGQQTGTRWLKMRDVSDSIEEWLVR